MKGKFKIAGTFFLTVVYSLAVNLVVYSSVHKEYGATYHPEQEQFHASFSDSLIFHTGPATDSGGSHFNIPGPDFRNKPALLSPLIYSARKLLDATFAQYAILSVNFPVRQRKADLIFPFHYFW